MSLHNRDALLNQPDTGGQSWVGALEARGGAFVGTAASFLRARRTSSDGPFSGGIDGLRWLARELTRFATLPEASDADEHAFVEGAGALLGLILIEHIANARHVANKNVHRVQLGAHGFFDPFAAIDQALDADDMRRSLAQSIDRAEAEARGEGPVSRVVRALAEGLSVERPHLRVVEQFDLKLTLVGEDAEDRVELDLSRAVRATESQGQHAVREVTARILSMLPGAPEVRLSLSEVRDRIVPRLSRCDVLLSLSSESRAALFHVPFVGDLVVAFLVEHEGRARYLRAKEAQGFGISDQALLDLACENLLKRSTRFRLTRLDPQNSGILISRSGDGRDSARILLPNVREALVARLGEEVIVGIPHRDAFLACNAGSEADVAMLRERVSHDAGRAPHRLSEVLFTCTRRSLTLQAR